MGLINILIIYTRIKNRGKTLKMSTEAPPKTETSETVTQLASSTVKWLPLGSNPEVINKYVKNLGINTDKFEYVDIYGLDPDLLAMVPKPIYAVLLLFPCTKMYTDYQFKKIEDIKAKGQEVSKNVFFTKQTVSNACGTVAIIHSLANNKEFLNIDPATSFGKFLDATREMTPAQAAEYLKTDASITNAHQASAEEGQTAPPPMEEQIELHFIAYVHRDG